MGVRPWVAMVLVVALSACGSDAGSEGGAEGGGDVDRKDAAAALEVQRIDVRAAAAELLRGAEAGLTGTIGASAGQYRGCTSTFNDQYRNFRYEASGRVDAGKSAARPYVDRLRAVLENAGFSTEGVTDRPGGTVLTGARGELSASFSELPGQGDYVLLSVKGPCVDVPEDQRETWLRKPEPTPEIL